MARPRIFISSTYYDLKQTRADIANFISNLGYEPVRNEEGNIPYGPKEKLEEYCYKEVQNVDILISIIGGRFGAESQNSKWSISNEELRKAFLLGKQIYIFIEKSVMSEYETYMCNKDTQGIKYRYVDNPKIYQFIEELKGLSSNNNIKAFETSADIQAYLKEQLAGLFQSFLADQAKMKDFDLSTRLENTTKTLENLVAYLKETNKDKDDKINMVLNMNHPLIQHLSKAINIKFNFWIKNLQELDDLLVSLGWQRKEEGTSDDANSYSWEKEFSGNTFEILKVAKEIFVESGILRDLNFSNWKDEYVVKEFYDIPTESSTLIHTDLPF